MKMFQASIVVWCASALALSACGSSDSSTSGSTDLVKNDGSSETTTTAQHCGGNMANAPQCVDGYECMPDPNSTLPFGDVGGICEPSHCGGNMANALQCTDGYDGVPDPNSTLPFGDVGGVCQLP